VGGGGNESSLVIRSQNQTVQPCHHHFYPVDCGGGGVAGFGSILTFWRKLWSP
jgi:hypothetical protein